MPEQPPKNATGSLRILVINKSPGSLRGDITRFNQVGYEQIDGVQDCRKAVDKLNDNTYDLIATGGITAFLRECDALRDRDRKKLRSLPLLVLGGRQSQNVLAAIRAGAADYLGGRYDNTLLRKKIDHLLQTDVPERKLPDDLVSLLPKTLTQDQIDILFWPDSPEEIDKLKADLKAVQSKEKSGKGDVLSNKEIDKLLSATGASGKKRKDNKPIITYDFKHPQRVSRDQQRTLENLHSNLSRTMASSFSTIQRAVVDVDIAFVDQTTYAEFIMSLSNPSCSYTFTIEPLSGPAIFDFSLPLVYSFIDRAFGGSGGNLPSEPRPLTAIERTVMGKVVTRILADLEATWEALLKIRVSDAELETNPEFMQIAAPSDTVILIAFEVNTQYTSSLVTLCLPYFTLEPVMPYLNVQSWAIRERGSGPTRQAKRLNQLKSIEADITAVWGRGSLSTEEVAGLREGDILVLDTRVEDPGVVFVENLPLFLARPGVGPKSRYAVEMLRTLSEEESRRHA